MIESKSNALSPAMNRKYPSIVRGEGVYIYDENGKRYLDGCGGAIVVNVGHGLQEFADVMREQAQAMAFVFRFHFTTPQLEEFTHKLCALTDFEMDKVFLCAGGSEATEIAVKLARKYHLDRGNASKYKVISRWQSYHGSTMGALAWTGFTQRRRLWDPYIQGGYHIPPAYCYRCPFDLSPDTCSLQCADALETLIKQEGAETVSAFIAEPISGAGLAGAAPRDDYFRRIREICDAYDVLLIMDEVMCSFGRAGKFFGYEHFGVAPDILIIGKGMSGGYYPLAGVMCRKPVADAIANGSGLFPAGYTYAGNPVGCAVGLKTIDYIQQNDLVTRCRERGEYLAARLERLRHHPTVGDIRGRGLLRGIEFVKDKETKECFDPEIFFHMQLHDEALEQGLTVLTSGGCNQGQAGDMILLGPPFIITEEQIDEMVEILDRAISVVERKNGFFSAEN